ncbi:cytochrome P450 [Actinospongicola halichondriae]|uniref:cytochrome P450 n=1 Tax=Actinospongicola halichondriae TaxID=3236844 RepID=UPI003D40539A
MSDESTVTLFQDPRAWEDMAAWHEQVAELRRDTPIVSVDHPDFEHYWVLTRHADVFDVERHPDLWRNTAQSALMSSSEWNDAMATGITPKALVHLDGEEHRAHRKVANDWFKPSATARWQERIDQIADEYIETMRELDGRCDFAIDVAQPFTLRVIMEIYGVPREDEPMMLELTQGMFGGSDPEFMGDAEDPIASALASVMTFIQYFNEMTEDRRACPQDDLGSIIANGEVDGCPISDEHRLWYYIIVATAGHDTTSFGLTGGLRELIERPDQFAALRDDPSLIVNATEEIIRWTSPVRHMLRTAEEDTRVGDVDMPAGSRVLLSYPSANRDEAVFERSMEFDVRRPDADKLLSFGLGPHFCLGAHFARREIRTMIGKLADQLDFIGLAGEPTDARAHFVGGTKHLPIEYRFR